MTITLELRENGHVMYLLLLDPLSAADIENTIAEQSPYYDRATFKLHQFIDVSRLKKLPTGILSVRRSNPPGFAHPNRGQVLMVGANRFVQTVAEALVKLAHYENMKFFSDEAAAWDYLRKVIAEEHQQENIV